MAEEKVEKFDPSKLMDGVKDRIKATFVSLIPDDQWQIMIEKEVDHFFKYQRDSNVGYSRFQPTEFSALCQTLILEECKKQIAAYLDGPEFKTVWNNNGLATVAPAVEKIIIENAGEVLVTMIGGVSSQMIHE